MELYFIFIRRKTNTVVSVDLVHNESKKNIKHFLIKSTRNQKRIAITTDLKPGYIRPIAELRLNTNCILHKTKNK